MATLLPTSAMAPQSSPAIALRMNRQVICCPSDANPLWRVLSPSLDQGGIMVSGGYLQETATGHSGGLGDTHHVEEGGGNVGQDATLLV